MEKILTVTIPSYNVEKYLRQTLDSFLAEEILEEIEILIVDDGSKDKTAAILSGYFQGKRGTRLYDQQRDTGGEGAVFQSGRRR